jgi:hypothetical protein
MKFNDSHKAVFLPVCEKVLCQYKGFVMNNEMRHNVKEKDVLYTKKDYSHNESLGNLKKTIIKEILMLKSSYSVIDQMFHQEMKNALLIKKNWIQHKLFNNLKLINPEKLNPFIEDLIDPFNKYNL